MKKRNFPLSLLAASLLVIFNSCGDKDEELPKTESNLVGIWEATSMEYNGKMEVEGLEDFFGGNTDLSEYFNSTFSGHAKNIDYVVEFTENPNEYTASGSYTIEFSMSMMGPPQEFDISPTGVKGTWELENGKLIIDSMGERQELIIETLTEETLKGSVSLVLEHHEPGAIVDGVQTGAYTIKRETNMVTEFRKK